MSLQLPTLGDVSLSSSKTPVSKTGQKSSPWTVPCTFKMTHPYSMDPPLLLRELGGHSLSCGHCGFDKTVMMI